MYYSTTVDHELQSNVLFTFLFDVCTVSPWEQNGDTVYLISVTGSLKKRSRESINVSFASGNFQRWMTRFLIALPSTVLLSLRIRQSPWGKIGLLKEISAEISFSLTSVTVIEWISSSLTLTTRWRTDIGSLPCLPPQPTNLNLSSFPLLLPRK